MICDCYVVLSELICLWYDIMKAWLVICYVTVMIYDMPTTCVRSTTRNKPINPKPNPSSTQNPIINLVAQTHLWPSPRLKPNGALVADNLQANQNRDPNKNFDLLLDSRCLRCCVQLRCWHMSSCSASSPSAWVDWTTQRWLFDSIFQFLLDFHRFDSLGPVFDPDYGNWGPFIAVFHIINFFF